MPALGRLCNARRAFLYSPSGALLLGGKQKQLKLDLSSLAEWENAGHGHQRVIERQKLPHKPSVGLQIFNLASFYWGGEISFKRYLVNICIN